MDDLVVRVVLVVAVVGLALLAGWVANRWQHPVHPPIDIAGLDLAPGVVAFTSTQCDNCKRVMAMLGTIDVPVREVTNELEAAMLAAANVEAVPLIAVTDRDGVLVRQLAGAPSKARLRRAIRAAGW